MVSKKTEGFEHTFREDHEPVVARSREGCDDGGDEGRDVDLDREAWQSDPDVLEDSVALYLAESGRTPLLNARQECMLGSQVEDGECLTRLMEQWEADHCRKASATDVLLVLMQRFSGETWLFEMLCQNLGLVPVGLVSDRVRHEAVRSAIDGRIDPQLADAIGGASGLGTAETTQALVQLSLDTRLIPWDIVGKAGAVDSMEQFAQALPSTELRRQMEMLEAQLEEHFHALREKAHQAFDHLVQANLRLVVSIAKKYVASGMPFLDLIQEGNLGLMHAARKYDHRRGYKFSTYATWWIRQAVGRGIVDQSHTIRLPVHTVDAIAKLNKAKQRLFQQYSRQPTSDEMAREAGISREKVEELLRVSSREAISLEMPVGGDDEGSELGDFIEDETVAAPADEAAQCLFREQMRNVVAMLPPRECRVIELRYGLVDGRNRTLEEIGTELGVTRERVRQIQAGALRKLRVPSRMHGLLDYLE